MTNKYRKPNFRRAAAFAACCLVMGSCTWEEFPELPPESQKPVDLRFTTAVNRVLGPDTRVIEEGTDFGSATSFPVSQTPYAIGMFLSNLNGSEVFEGAGNMKAEMTMISKDPAGAENTSWQYFASNGNRAIPRGFPGAQIRLTAYHPWNPEALADSIPFDFTRKVNTDTGEARAQTNLLLCNTRAVTIPANPASNPLQLGFKNAYTKIVLRVTKREDKNDSQNAGTVTATAIDNLTSNWIKNLGGIDPATGYVKSTSQPGRIWNDSTAHLTTTVPVEFTFLVPAFMDQNVQDDQFGFVLLIDGEQRLFPLKQSQLNSGRNANGKITYGFESNKINTYNLVYNNSVLFLSLQSWNSVDASANFGESAEKNPIFELDLRKSRTQLGLVVQKEQNAEPSSIPELNYPKDPTEDPWQNYNDPGGTGRDMFKYITTHLNNTYLSSVLLGGNGLAIEAKDAGKLYTLEKPYVKLQVSAIDVGGKAVVWQDEKGGLIAKDVCRNYRGNSKSDWRLPRVSEMKVIMMWAVYNRNMETFLGNSGQRFMEKEDATPYWTATEAFMGTPGIVDNQETAWYVQGYRNSLNKWNYKVEPRNKQDAAFIRCVREMEQ